MISLHNCDPTFDKYCLWRLFYFLEGCIQFAWMGDIWGENVEEITFLNVCKGLAS